MIIKNLKKAKFKINYFTTSRKRLLKREKFINNNFFYKTLIKLFVLVPFFPLNHLGGQIIICASKEIK